MIFDQFSGISGLYLFSTGLFQSMRKDGEFDMDITTTTQMINLFNFIGSLLYTIPNELGLAQKTTMVMG